MKIFYFLASLPFSLASLTVNLSTDSAPFTGGIYDPIGNQFDLRGTLNFINQNPGNYTVDFSLSNPQITLEGMLPLLNLNGGGNTLVVDGGGSIVIDGAGTFPGFFANAGNVSLQNLTVQNTSIHGGAGSGGGLGAGGALFVNQGCNVTLENITLQKASANGGEGAFGFSGSTALGAGGGGMGGNGGDSQSTTNVGSGGGGFGGNGGLGVSGPNGGGGGGGIGPGGNGAPANTAGSPGGAYGGDPGGNGGGGVGLYGGANGGGGGGGYFGGGGGGGGIDGQNSGIQGAPAGAGGFGGGGGGNFIGTYHSQGGSGGDFGGGGAAYYSGAGGFGGGGGGGIYVPTYANSTAGSGGFGGGGGGGLHPGTGGIGAGQGSPSGGGGGAGFGGAIFVREGGQLSLVGSGLLINNNVTAGSGGSFSSSGGAAAGTDLFIMGGLTVNFIPGALETILVSGSIADSSSNSLPSGRGFTPGSGPGGVVIVNGPGNVVFKGNNTYSGTTQITSGTLEIDGSHQSPVNVSIGGVLSGTGALFNNDLRVFGTLSPGVLTGTKLSVDAINFETGSTFLINLNPTVSSELVVTGSGTTTIPSGVNLQVVAGPGTYINNTIYPVLESEMGTLSGSFNLINPPNLKFSLFEDTAHHFLFLKLVSGGIFQISTAGLEGNNLILADYINQNSTALQPILRDLTALSFNDLNNALTTIDPARNAFSTFAEQNSTFLFSNIVTSHFADYRFCKCCCPQGVWISGFGEFAHQKEQSETPAFDFDTGGILIGYDIISTPSLLFGASVGYANIELWEKFGFGKERVNEVIASLYSTVNVCSFFAEAILWGGFGKMHSIRNIFYPGFFATARSDRDSYFLTPHLGVGYDFSFENTLLEPFIECDWAFNFDGDFKERGAGIYTMHQERNNSSLLRTEAGLTALQKISCFVVREKLSYVNKKPFNVGRVTASIVGANGSFTVNTLTRSQNLVSPGIELFYKGENGLFASLSYEGEFSKDYTANNGYLNLGMEF